jgi:hypothetical protein
MALIRDLIETIDATIENVIDAHGFSFSALNADDQGALVHFAAPDANGALQWRLTFGLPARGPAHVRLQKGDPAAPEVALHLIAGSSEKVALPAALATTMELFASLNL